MPTYYDSKGNAHDLSEKIGSGGEGTVFVCPLDRAMVAKIYHEPITADKAAKLRWMAENKNEHLLKIAAWVIDVLTDAPNGKVVGFLMPNVRAKDIHELYSLKSRRIHFPEATWIFLVHTAGNLARAFYNLHKNDHIMGDINHGNCVVLADGTVKLIDCDSYSINDGTRRYPCEVGVATHLAPELQGMNLRGVKREKKHDNFGLAVIIFQLLFLGRHPFAGNFIGDEDKSLEECIREFRFAYGANAHLRRVRQPPGTLSLSAVSPRIALMLERAFLTEDRPEPREWVEALEDLKENLKQCVIHPGHHFYQNLLSCPWCELETKTGLMIFPFTSGNQTLEEDEVFNIFTIETLLSQISPPRNLPAVLSKPASTIPIFPEERIELENRQQYQNVSIIALVQVVLILFLTFAFGSGLAFFIGLITMSAAIVYVVNNYKSIREALETEVEFRNEDWNKLRNEWEKTTAANYLEKDIETIRSKVDDYQNLQKDSRQKIKLLQDEALRYQLETHLSNYALAGSKIAGIKAESISQIEKYGIKTAADVETKRLQTIPEIDGYLSTKLLDWRKNLERHFEYQPNVPLPESSHQRVLHEFNEKRRKIEKDIEKLLTAARMSANSLFQKQKQILAQTEKTAQELMQAEVNLKAAGSNAAAVFVLLFVTGMSLVFGNSFLSEPPKAVLKQAPKVYDEYGTKSGISAAKPPPPTTVEDYLPVDLTDDEINLMSENKKRELAEKIYSNTVAYSNSDGDYSRYDEKPEKRLRLAVKLQPNERKYVNKLGYILYNRGKYEEAIEFLKKSVNNKIFDYDTRNYIGMSYLQLDKFDEAQKIFLLLTRNSPDIFEGHYNLGLTYKNMEKYDLAVKAFSRGLMISPGDPQSNYELASCYLKLGKKWEAEKIYQNLLNYDTRKANDLRRLIDMYADKGIGDGE
ncbi:MAG: tetratricopeptide repeat protein [Pyrinomonadaceae bacterium]|nr:tetratricopeptide repeat protein [Pyrinomonadaceae bacterium]